MSVVDGSEPIANDEIVYRRVSENSGWYDPASDRPIAWEAFKPNKNDHDGISVWRAKYLTAREAASIEAREGRIYYVLAIRAGTLRKAGVKIEPTPQHGATGHASLANLSLPMYDENRDAIRELAGRIASDLVEKIHGPFGPFPS